MNYQAAGGGRQAAGARALMLLLLALFASGVSAQERTPDQAELLY